MLFKHGDGHGQLGPDIVGDQVGKVARLAHASTSLQQRTPSGRARFAGPHAGLTAWATLQARSEAAAVDRDLNALTLARLVQRLRRASRQASASVFGPRRRRWRGWMGDGRRPALSGIASMVRGRFSLVKPTLVSGVLLGNGASGPAAIPMARPAPEAHART